MDEAIGGSCSECFCHPHPPQGGNYNLQRGLVDGTGEKTQVSGRKYQDISVIRVQRTKSLKYSVQ